MTTSPLVIAPAAVAAADLVKVYGSGDTAVYALGGVTASACIYRVPSRPAWNTPLTLVQFNLTALTLGPLFAAATIGTTGVRWLPAAIAAAAGAQFVVLALRFFRMSGSDAVELQASSRLLATTLRTPLIARGLLLALGARPRTDLNASRQPCFPATVAVFLLAW